MTLTTAHMVEILEEAKMKSYENHSAAAVGALADGTVAVVEQELDAGGILLGDDVIPNGIGHGQAGASPFFQYLGIADMVIGIYQIGSSFLV